MKTLLQTSIIILSTVLSSASASELVEIRLVDNVDEKRGYCLDIAGGRGKDAPLNKGLQAHTCYDYNGSLLEDQSFDLDLIKQDQFKIPYFNVCMTSSSLKAGADILIASCANNSVQGFTLQPNGNLVLKANPKLCVTVNSSKIKKGRGGEPVHIMRPLSLQACNASESAYQVWTTFSL